MSDIFNHEKVHGSAIGNHKLLRSMSGECSVILYATRGLSTIQKTLDFVSGSDAMLANFFSVRMRISRKLK